MSWPLVGENFSGSNSYMTGLYSPSSGAVRTNTLLYNGVPIKYSDTFMPKSPVKKKVGLVDQSSCITRVRVKESDGSYTDVLHKGWFATGGSACYCLDHSNWWTPYNWTKADWDLVYGLVTDVISADNSHWYLMDRSSCSQSIVGGTVTYYGVGYPGEYQYNYYTYGDGNYTDYYLNDNVANTFMIRTYAWYASMTDFENISYSGFDEPGSVKNGLQFGERSSCTGMFQGDDGDFGLLQIVVKFPSLEGKPYNWGNGDYSTVASYVVGVRYNDWDHFLESPSALATKVGSSLLSLAPWNNPNNTEGSILSAINTAMNSMTGSYYWGDWGFGIFPSILTRPLIGYNGFIRASGTGNGSMVTPSNSFSSNYYTGTAPSTYAEDYKTFNGASFPAEYNLMGNTRAWLFEYGAQFYGRHNGSMTNIEYDELSFRGMSSCGTYSKSTDSYLSIPDWNNPSTMKSVYSTGELHQFSSCWNPRYNYSSTRSEQLRSYHVNCRVRVPLRLSSLSLVPVKLRFNSNVLVHTYY